MLKLPEQPTMNWSELMEEARSAIAFVNPAWTDHNPSDPGIALLELFAWLTEMVLYRANELTDDTYWTFLKLIQGAEVDRSSGLEPAIQCTVKDLRTRFRAITPTDYEELAMDQWPGSLGAQALGWRKDIGRIVCIPEKNLDDLARRLMVNTAPPIVMDTSEEPPLDPHSNAIEPDKPEATMSEPMLEPSAAPGYISLVVLPERPLLAFEKSGLFVKFDTDPYLRLNGDLTVAGWFCPRDITLGNQPLIVRGSEFAVIMLESGNLFVGHGTEGLMTAPSSVQSKRWYHFAMVRTASQKAITVYMDGVLAVQGTYTQEPTADHAPIYVGGTEESTRNFEGLLVDMSVYRRTLTASEVKNLRNTPAVSGRDCVACISRPDSNSWHTSSGQALSDPSLSGPRWRYFAHQDLLAGLKEFFDVRRLLTTRLALMSPGFVEMTVEATLYLRSDADLASVTRRADSAIRSLFEIRSGGPEKRGWPFGRNPYLSDVYVALENVEGVDFVRQGRLQPGDSSRALISELPSDAEPAASMPSEAPPPYGIRLYPHELPVVQSIALKFMQPRRGSWKEVYP